MQRSFRRLSVLLFVCAATTPLSADWRQFRGPGGQGATVEKALPIEWSSTKNVAWKTRLPGLGASSPVILGNRVFITCYSGYGMEVKNPGKMEDLRRHLLCLDRRTGNILWTKEFSPDLPEHNYHGEGSYHGYAASTPATDGEHLFVFFGKSGVFCFDLDGTQVWHVSVGKGKNGWGSGASPLLYKNTVIINASVESGAMVALDKANGKEIWRAPKINSAWNTPVLVPVAGQGSELVISIQNTVLGFNPDTGTELWRCDGIHRYVCPSVIDHDGVVYVTGGGGGYATLAVRAGGRGDVTKTHVLWRITKASNVASPVYYHGHIYWAGDETVVCQEAATGKVLYNERLDPPAGRIWASPVLTADGKIYYVSQSNGIYVVAAQPKFEQLAHNVFADDKSRDNGSIAVSDGQLFVRTDQYLYCIGKQ